MAQDDRDIIDVYVIGGGINGVGIARDAAGRGLSVVLAEMNDLASATSSSSSKLFHGGLRYLEYFELRLVKKALLEREILLQNMPHICWPMRFVLPYHKDMRFDVQTPASRMLALIMPWMRGRRPKWMIRFGLFLYDHLGGRKILPPTSRVDLGTDPVGEALQPRFSSAYEYSDCWVNDSRLVVLNARDAQMRGAKIMPRTTVISAERYTGFWIIKAQDNATKEIITTHARTLVNAGGPWAEHIIKDTAGQTTTESVRLVRGSHIITHKLFDHDKAYILQGTDGRIIFAIPYENDFTLIGTTEAEHKTPFEKPSCSPEETEYLCDFASNYFKKKITPQDVIWSYSGARPLYDDGAASASAATRDYVLKVNTKDNQAPMLNVFGGKITTYRKLAENALAKLSSFLPDMRSDWTHDAPLPGGDFPYDQVKSLKADLKKKYSFLTEFWAERLIRFYGTDADALLGNATSASDLGQEFGATLTAREVIWLMRHEFAQTAEDIVWRRSRLGLRLTRGQIDHLDEWMATARAEMKL